MVGQFKTIAISVCLSDVMGDAFEYNGKSYVKLMVGEMRQKDERGKTHTVWIDDFKPESQRERVPQSYEEQQAQEDASAGSAEEEINPDDIPF